MEAAALRLKNREDRRLRGGHVWVFSNEVDVEATPLNGFEPGQPVIIEDSRGKALGSGYVNPNSLICARLVSRNPAVTLDRALIVHRLNVALALRERLFAQPYYRLLFGESDGLPGLVVDRYGDVLVAQLNTAGMERVQEDVVAALVQVLRPTAIVLRNDTASRALEGLHCNVVTAVGTAPDMVRLHENAACFEVPILGGQKTGWFFDQRMNRARMLDYVGGRRVLDVFSYMGAWGIQAASRGAAEVVCVDSSDKALAQLRCNAELNGVENKTRTIRGDAFAVLRELRAERERFDVVIVDPPAFIKRKKDRAAGEEAYQRINRQAMQVLAKDGLLISASCSFHLPAAELQRILLTAGRHLDRTLQILEQGHQAPDHPILPALAETAYLKAFFARVLPAD